MLSEAAGPRRVFSTRRVRISQRREDATRLSAGVARWPKDCRARTPRRRSEFRAEFEAACKAKNLTLYVLPPKRPQLNGAVERAQGSWRYEFYACYDLPFHIDKLQRRVDAFAYRFNHIRPHDALDGQTPAEYLNAISAQASKSHMC